LYSTLSKLKGLQFSKNELSFFFLVYIIIVIVVIIVIVIIIIIIIIILRRSYDWRSALLCSLQEGIPQHSFKTSIELVQVDKLQEGGFSINV